MEKNLLQNLVRPVYCYLNEIWKVITDIKNSLWKIKNDGIGTEKIPVTDIFTKRIKVGRNSIRIDEKNINFESEGTKISGRRIGDEVKPFEEIHSSNIYAEKVGTLAKPVQSIVSELIGVKGIGVETEMIAKSIIAEQIVVPEGTAEIKNVTAENVTAENVIAANVTASKLNGVATKSYGIYYISADEPSEAQVGDFWLDITNQANPELKISYNGIWKTVANL